MTTLNILLMLIVAPGLIVVGIVLVRDLRTTWNGPVLQQERRAEARNLGATLDALHAWDTLSGARRR
jgi:hypothetical protein